MAAREFEGFAFFDLENPLVAWNVVRGVYYSADHLQNNGAASAISVAMAGLLRNCSPNRISSEFSLEAFRAENYPNEVSRLQGLFVFDDIESVAEVWDGEIWGSHFCSENLSDVGVYAAKSSRLDSNWISNIMKDDCALTSGWEDMAHAYWQAKVFQDTRPIWENIVQGAVTIWGIDLKQRAIDEIRKYWPNSLKLLEYSANAAALGSYDGIVSPISIYDGYKINIDYRIRMVDATDESFCNKLSELRKSGDTRVARFTDSLDLVCPDFTCYSFDRTVTNGSLVGPL